MNKNKYGFTLIEIITVIAIIAVLITISIPATRALQNSFASGWSKPAFNEMLSFARATAGQQHKYAGIRFQRQGNTQYAVFIVQGQERPYPDDEKEIPYPDDGKTIPFIALGNQPTNLGTKRAIASGANNKVTVIFSPTGKLVKKWVMLFSNPALEEDDIFGHLGLFAEDKTSHLSDNAFIIYSTKEPKISNNAKKVFINSYTGKLIL